MKCDRGEGEGEREGGAEVVCELQSWVWCGGGVGGLLEY